MKALEADLFLKINGRLYLLTKLGNEGWRLVKNADGECHDVSIRPHGPQCDCPDAIFRKRAHNCKHINGLRKVGLI